MPDQDFSPLTAAVVEPLLGLLTLVLILSLLKAFLPRLRGLLGERAVARVLKRQALRVANDIILPDGRGGLTQIDHLVLTPTGILVIETKNYSGLIFGREREARWTQVVGRHRHPFQNPLRQNYGHIKAVETLTTTIAVEGRVVFVGRARFPKGRPPGVVDLAGLQRDLAAMPKREIPLALRLEWEALIAQARQDRRTRRASISAASANAMMIRLPRPGSIRAQAPGGRL
ncbi:nuclease-related domain-containing protein [Lamprobacter modestohalophilus]|uniref:nuclease-related domain-containing protein n=1 Tax=Lamprobacter modestohalophilus TaxID=1064514 RepID=UPI002ADEF3A9|nr:nuclease-related domain-containing protein [Lamprobacter modestohalophilus]MEA1052253.1 nuclease-related domain-containing protein [Lamprobacter modestohalophilus]